jgi:hypothetical protein
MPRVPSLPAGSLRIFGRIDRFTCECPKCGQLLRAAFERVIGAERRKAAKGQHVRGAFNPLTSRLTCTRCGGVFGVGLLLYPVHARSAPDQPGDTKPTWKQLLALRSLTMAALLPVPIKGRDSVNLAVEGICRCGQDNRGHVIGDRVDPTCPVHGWQEQLGPKSATSEAELAREAATPILQPERRIGPKDRRKWAYIVPSQPPVGGE